MTTWKPPFIVQTQDAEGFWSNHGDYTSLNLAKAAADHEAKERGSEARVVCGPKRIVCHVALSHD